MIDTMDIYARHGDKVIFTGEGGWDLENERANSILEVGKVYTVIETMVGQSSSQVRLAGFRDQSFNTVMFEDLKTHYLVKYSDNWADEIDIDGHVVLDAETCNQLFENINRIDEEEYSFYFNIGTNESIEYESSESLSDTLQVIPITEREYRTLKKVGLLYSGFAEDLVDYIFEKFGNGLE